MTKQQSTQLAYRFAERLFQRLEVCACGLNPAPNAPSTSTSLAGAGWLDQLIRTPREASQWPPGTLAWVFAHENDQRR
jgi:hypothetical protein